MKEKTFTLSLTEKQAQALSAACETVSRIHMGQLQNAVTEALENIPPDRRNALADGLKQLESLVTGFNTGGYNDIMSERIPDTARILFDLHQVLRHKISWEKNPKGGIQNWFDTPHKTSTTQNLPQIGTNVQ